MKTRFLLAALVLAVSPGMALATCYGGHATEDLVMSCADGTVYDAETQSCVTDTTS